MTHFWDMESRVGMDWTLFMLEISQQLQVRAKIMAHFSTFNQHRRVWVTRLLVKDILETILGELTSKGHIAALIMLASTKTILSFWQEVEETQTLKVLTTKEATAEEIIPLIITITADIKISLKIKKFKLLKMLSQINMPLRWCLLVHTKMILQILPHLLEMELRIMDNQ